MTAIGPVAASVRSDGISLTVVVLAAVVVVLVVVVVVVLRNR
jgi:hypothetical protein